MKRIRFFVLLFLYFYSFVYAQTDIACVCVVFGCAYYDLVYCFALPFSERKKKTLEKKNRPAHLLPVFLFALWVRVERRDKKAQSIQII